MMMILTHVVKRISKTYSVYLDILRLNMYRRLGYLRYIKHDSLRMVGRSIGLTSA